MKNKAKLLFNVIAVVLCVCAMAIGVYSAKQASLTANGQIGFKAHNCEVILNGTIDAYQSGGDTVLNKSQDIATNKTTGGKITNVNIGGTNGVSTLTLPAMYFSDTGTNGNTITLNLTTANQSVFDVSAKISVIGDMPTGVTYAISTEEYVMGALNSITDEKSFTITFTLSDPTTSADFGDTAFKIIMEFEKYEAPKTRDYLKISNSANGNTGLKVGGLYVEMGSYNGTPLKWYAFGFSASGSEEISTGNMQPITFAYTNLDDVESGTYYFISEFALGQSKFQMTLGNKTDLEYNGSRLQISISYLETDTTYKINQSEIYSFISKRNLDAETYLDGDSATDVTQATPNQTLWPLSKNEIENLLFKNRNSSGAIANNKSALITSSTTTTGWWTRSPLIFNNPDAYVYMVDSNGNLSNLEEYSLSHHMYVYGVRPAFKLVVN